MEYREIELGSTLKDINWEVPVIQTIPNVEITLHVADQNTGVFSDFTLATNEWVINEMINKYGDFKILTPLKNTPISVDSDRLILGKVFKHFLSQCSLINYSKLYEAFSYRYNPIENYDRISEIKVSYEGEEKNTNTNVGKEINTLEYSGDETTATTYSGETTSTFKTPENGYTDTSTNSRSPENNDTFYGTEKTTSVIAHREEETTTGYTDRTDSTTKSFDGRTDKNTKEFTNRIETDVKEYTDRFDKTEEHTHGNIGVSTPMDMALKELEARKFDLQKYIIHQFVIECCVL